MFVKVVLCKGLSHLQVLYKHEKPATEAGFLEVVPISFVILPLVFLIPGFRDPSPREAHSAQ